MDLQKRSDMLARAKKALSDKSAGEKLHKSGKKTAHETLAGFFDDGTFSEIASYVKAYVNELGTTDPEGYEAVVCGYGAVDGRLVFAYAEDLSRLNGAFTKAAAGKIAAVYDMAKKNGAPVVSFLDSNGAKVPEGIDVLAGYGTVMQKVASVKGKVPQIAVVLGKAVGAAAVIASMADVTFAVEGASFSVLPANVLVDAGAEKTVGTADYAFENGFVADKAVTAEEAFAKVRAVLSYLPSNKLDKNVYAGVEDDANRATPEIASIAAKADYDAHALLSVIADGGAYYELSAGKGKSMLTAFAFIGGIPVGVIANDPSHNGGKLCACGLSKAAMFVKLCNSFGISLLNLVGTAGFSEKCEANGADVAGKAAWLADAYARASVPVVTLNVGEAYGSAFAVMGSKALGADVVYALDTAKIGVLSPASGVAMLWSDKLAGAKAPMEKRAALEEDYALHCEAPLLAAYAGEIDDVIPAELVRAKLASALDMLSMKTQFAAL